MRLNVRLTLLICMVIMIATPAKAIENSVSTAFTIGSKSAQGMDIQFTLPDYEIEQETVAGTVYDKITLPGSGLLAEAGMPELPVLSTMIAIPNRGRAYLEVIDTQTKVVEQIIPFPAQNEDTNPRDLEVNRACYEGNQIYPQEALLYGEPQILRDFRLISVQVQPFAWDSATHQLIVRDQMTLRVRFTDEPGSNELEDIPRNISTGFDKIYQSMILNYNDFRPNATLIAQTPPRIIIIHGAYNNASFQQKLDNFAFWKRQKGADVRVVSTAITGATTTGIKTYLQGLYDDINSRPDFVILVGDVTGWFLVPTYSVYGGISDYPYQMLAGNDELGDCFIGRISAENVSQLDVLFAKVYAYEKNMNMANAGYLNRMLTVADTAHDGISVVYLIRYIQELALAHNPDFIYYCPTIYNPPPMEMNNAINQGVGFFYYRGYIGMSGWSPDEDLVNINKLVHAVIITCSTGNFDGVSTAEIFTLLGTSAAPKGAITAIGESTSGNHTMPNNCITGAIADGIYARGMRTMGEALLHGKLYVSTMYQTTQPYIATRVNHWCNLIGDPTVEVYITIPHTFDIDAPDTLALGTPNLGLNVKDENGDTVANACVTISQGTLILGRSYTNESGYVYLPINPGLADTLATVTVSKHDFKPLQINIVVDVSGSLVAGVSQCDDDSLGNSIGNGNYSPNSGERLEVSFAVKNTTGNMVGQVSGYVTSDNPYITVIDSLLNFENIASGATVFSFSPALIDVAPTCPANTYLSLVLHLTDALDTPYLVPTDLYITDALLHYVSHQVTDTNNQVLDPGETVTLNLTITNSGSISINDVSGQLYAINDMVTIVDNTAIFGNIAVNGQAMSTTDNFALQGSINIFPGMQIPLRLKLTNPAGFRQWIDFTLNVGVAEVTSPYGPDGYGYVIYDDGDTSYPECPEYQWIGIAPEEGGTGTLLGLSDPATGTEGDAVGAVSLATVTLPFSFQFYGVEYTQMTVCTNGFIAMGVTLDACFRNYRLPGAMGPGAMIAPFWDDLATVTGAGVYTWYDASNHRFVVEWYHMRNGYQTTSLETFQVILYDPAFYPTSLGDGPIKFQYLTFNNVDSGTGFQEHGAYSTIGIQDLYHHNGLEYSFNNQYPPAARPLANGRCILITNAPAYSVQPILNIGQQQISDSNDNGIPEPGETINLNVELVNSGPGDAVNPIVILSTPDSLVNITNATVNYPAIAANDSGYSLTPFDFEIAPDCPPNHEIVFYLNVASDGYTDQIQYIMTVGTPVSIPDTPQISGVNCLYGSYPNPTHQDASMAFSLAKSARASLRIYNIRGQLIKTLVDESKAAGLHKVVWNGTDNEQKKVTSGIYLYRLEAGTFKSTRKLILIK